MRKFFNGALGILLLAGIAGGVAYQTGMLQPSTTETAANIEEPSMSVEDIGDWGEVTDGSIEVIHTLNVQNPNPVNAQVGKETTVRVNLQFNGVPLGSVEKTGLDIQQGNNTVQITSQLQQDRIAEFWSKFINQDETIHAEVSVSLEVNAGPGFSVSTPPVQVSALTDEEPISEALDKMGEEMEGTYTKDVSTDKLAEDYLPSSGLESAPSGTVTAGYTLERVDFEWGEVTSEQTELKIHLRVRNSGDMPLPANPDGAALDLSLNGVEAFTARTEAISVQNIGDKRIIGPGETKSYTLTATTENEKIEEWFTAYASQRENADVRGEIELYFDLGETSLSLPEDGALAYECQMQTGVFVDDQSASTTCGKSGTVEIGRTKFEVSELQEGGTGSSGTSESTSTATPTQQPQTTEAADSESPPTARIEANPTQGEPPLEVTLDASSSTDPDGNIEEYTWVFGDATAPKRGETITHTFRSAGQHEVNLVVVDSQGNQDRATVTITVERRTS